MNNQSNRIISNRRELEIYIISYIGCNKDYVPPLWLKPLHFADTFHQRMYEIYRQLRANSQETSINAIRKHYNSKYERKSTEFLAYINHFYDVKYDIETALQELKEYFIDSSITEISVNSRGAKDQGSYARMKLEEALQSVAEKEKRTLQDAISESLDNIEERISYVREGKEIPGVVYTGIHELDRFLGGIYPGENVVIGGTTGMGKSTFARMLSINTTLPVLYFTLEMPDKQILEKMACTIAEIDQMKLRNGQLSDHDYQKWVTAMANISRLDLTFEKISSIHDFSDSVKMWRQDTDQDKTGIVIIDYLQQITNDQKGRTRDQELQEISRLVKKLAISENLVMFTFAQLSRALEKRGGDKKPLLSDLRESGTIEQDADIVGFMYRPEYYGFVTDDEGNATLGLAEMIIRKSRNGQTGSIKMQFIGKYGKIQDWATTGLEEAHRFNVINLPKVGDMAQDYLNGEVPF